MKAIRLARFGDPSVLTLQDIEAPTAGPRDVLIRVHAAAVNPVDAKIRKGTQRAIVRHPLPHTLGMDLSGVVTAVGAEVRDFRVGDEVFSSPSHKRMGSYAEYAAVDEREVARKPKGISHVEAASLPLVALTVWDSLVTFGKLERGQRVLIQAGAGGVGTIAVQLAAHLGAEVFATASARNVELVRSLGAHRVIDYDKERYEEVARGVDLVVDSLGPAHFARALETVRRGGRVVALASGIPDAVESLGPYLGVLRAGARLARFVVQARLTKNVRFAPVARVASGANLARIAALVEAGTLKPVIDSVLPLEEAAEAHRRMEGGRSRGKVVLEVLAPGGSA